MLSTAAHAMRNPSRRSRRTTLTITAASGHEVLEARRHLHRFAASVHELYPWAAAHDLPDRGEGGAGRPAKTIGEARDGRRRAREKELVILAATGGPDTCILAEGGRDRPGAVRHRNPVQVNAGAHTTLANDVAEVGGQTVGEVDHRRHPRGRPQPLSFLDPRPRPQVRGDRFRARTGLDARQPLLPLEEGKPCARSTERPGDRD